jgi:putative spermidine/putrescine transport system substrate-binding protein
MNINRLQPIRKENIPNANDIFPALLERDAWVKGYGVPFDGGLYLPVYAPKATGFTISSWKDMMKPELHGKLTLDQAFYYGLYAAAYISDMEPGAKELYSKEGLDECFKLGAQLAKSVKKFYKGGAEFFNLLQTGEVAMGAYYSGGTYAQKNKGVDVDMVLADEGVIAWIGYMTVMKGTKNRDLAEAFINYSLDPKRQSAFAKESGNWVSGSKAEVPAALKGINPSSNKDFQKITFFDWDLLNNKWTELEERWKKEVLVQPQ